MVDNVNIDDTVGMVVDALYDVIEQSEERGSGGRVRDGASAVGSRW